jgi:hypothetical protein
MNSLLFTLAQITTTPLPKVDAGVNQINNITTIVFSITGAISVLVITIAGFQYITSQGNPQAVGKAKNAIIYACVGVVVSILAFAIVNFVTRGVT